MDIDKHASEVMRTASFDINVAAVPSNLLHAAIGAATEVGELLDAIKRGIYYGKPLDLLNVVEEIGDIYWYLGLACNAINVQPSSVLKKNSNKLKARYPQKFTQEAANIRDLAKEIKAIEGAV